MNNLTKFGTIEVDLDETDRGILAVLQNDAKASLARIGDAVGLSPPSIVERIRKLEQAGVIRGYHAVVDGRRIGLDVTAFIGVSINYPKMMSRFEVEVSTLPEILECHHVTGEHSLLVKVRTRSTATLEALISKLRSIDGVQRTDTMVVFSTRVERTQLPLALDMAPAPLSEIPRQASNSLDSRARSGQHRRRTRQPQALGTRKNTSRRQDPDENDR